MNRLEYALRNHKRIRVIGFDDAPFLQARGYPVKVSGIVCAGTRFEGMLWGEITKDGLNSTEVLTKLLSGSKFLEQIHLVLVDGIALGGFNIIDLPMLSNAIERPCVAVMRKKPDLNAIDAALKNFDDYSVRRKLIEKAGEIHELGTFVFQVYGAEPETVSAVLAKLTDNGNVPEALRIAHLIGSAVMTGQSSSRA